MSMKQQLLTQLILQDELSKSKSPQSLGKRVLFQSQISKIAQENPDLSPQFIRKILIADKEPVVSEYVLNWVVSNPPDIFKVVTP